MTRRSAPAFALSLLAAAYAALATPAAAQAVNGETLFRQRCQSCHGTAGKPTPLAPDLAGVVGRKAGSTTFNHSPALKKSGVTWTRATLDTFLAAPMKMVPGTRMVISVPDAAQRKALVAYLATLRR